MTGLLLVVIAIFWLVVVVMITRGVISHFRSAGAKAAVGTVIFAALLTLPMLDEIIGARQFEALCEQYALQIVDEQHAMNRRVAYVRRTVDRYADGTAVRIRIDAHIYKDAETGQVLVSYHSLHAEGGWLIRSLGVSETKSPLLFVRSCGPTDEDAFKRKFNITVIN